MILGQFLRKLNSIGMTIKTDSMKVVVLDMAEQEAYAEVSREEEAEATYYLPAYQLPKGSRRDLFFDAVDEYAKTPIEKR